MKLDVQLYFAGDEQGSACICMVGPVTWTFPEVAQLLLHKME